MLRADFHIHTRYSHDSNMEPEELVRKAKKIGMDVIAVTDHDTTKGFGEVERYAKSIYPDLILFRGEEVRVKGGEIIGINIKEDIPRKLDPSEACRRVKKQGGFVILPHPFDRFRKGLGKSSENIANLLDAVEGFNSRTLFSRFNGEALSFANRNGIPALAGSDSHFIEEFGSSWTYVDSERSKEDVLKAVKGGKIRLHCRGTGIVPHIKTQLVRFKLV